MGRGRELVSGADGCHRCWVQHKTLPEAIMSELSSLNEQEQLQALPLYISLKVQQLFLERMQMQNNDNNAYLQLLLRRKHSF